MGKSQSRLLKASIIVTFISLLGKVIGFIRDAVIAAHYGANWQTDAFFFAQSMPSIIFPAVCNSLSTAFLSIYVSKSLESKDEADQYGSKAVTFSAFVAIALSLIAIILTPIIVPALAPGFNKEQIELARHLTRITMAAFVLIMIQYMLGAILSAKKLFYGAQVAALFYNISVIVITIILGNGQNMDALTYTVVVGHIIQVMSLIVFVKNSFRYSFTFFVFDNETKALVRLTLPIILGNSIVQINNIVDKVLSSLFGDGAMSALSYSNTLNRFVTGIVITTLSTVIYPIMAEQYSKNEEKDFANTIRNSISIGVIILLPISVVTTICANDIVKMVYQRGSFDSNATNLTSYALLFYGMMYVFSAVQEVVTRAFYSMKDTKTPLKTAALAILSNAIMSFFFSVSLGMGLGGIALGTTLSTLFAALLLLIVLRKKVGNLELGKLKNTFIKIFISSGLIILIASVSRQILINSNVIVRFAAVTIIAFSVHFVVLTALNCEEVYEFKRILQKMIMRKKQ